jgi:enoyl-CoA hydratase/carnithine racemase
MDMILTSSTITGKELRHLGLVSQTWPIEELFDKTLATAHKIASLSVPVVVLAKAAILNGAFDPNINTCVVSG